MPVLSAIWISVSSRAAFFAASHFTTAVLSCGLTFIHVYLGVFLCRSPWFVSVLWYCGNTAVLWRFYSQETCNICLMPCTPWELYKTITQASRVLVKFVSLGSGIKGHKHWKTTFKKNVGHINHFLLEGLVNLLHYGQDSAGKQATFG